MNGIYRGDAIFKVQRYFNKDVVLKGDQLWHEFYRIEICSVMFHETDSIIYIKPNSELIHHGDLEDLIYLALKKLGIKREFRELFHRRYPDSDSIITLERTNYFVSNSWNKRNRRSGLLMECANVLNDPELFKQLLLECKSDFREQAVSLIRNDMISNQECKSLLMHRISEFDSDMNDIIEL